MVMVKEPEHPNSRVMIINHRARAECKLDMYLLRGRIDRTEHEAGMKFRYAWLNRVHRIRDINPLEPGVGMHTSFLEASETLCYSEKIIREAFEILPDAQRRAVVSVCGEDEFANHTRELRRGLEKISRAWRLN